jgi:cytochrome b6-f complex iron-sulfur subunit
VRTTTASRRYAYKGDRAARKPTNDNEEEVGLAEEQLSRARFIRLGAALGVGAAGASVIAACGDGGGEGAADNGGAATTEPAPASGAGETTQPVEETTQATEDASAGGGGGGGDAIASESEVPPGTAVPFDEGGRPAILVHLEGGEFAAYSAVCTHQGCTVAYQEQSAQIACPCHGSVFDPANGAAVVNGPAQMPLPGIPVEVRDGEVFRA